MKKIFLVLAGLACTAQLTYAKSVTESAARTTAANFCRTKGINSADLSLAYKSVNAGKATYYVFNTGSNGFVIVAADDLAAPILGYSEESGFDITKISPETAYWLGKYDAQIAYSEQHSVQPDADITAAWSQLSLVGPATTAERTTSVASLVHTVWNQMPIYNAMCPHSGTDTAVTGCVATAMAQVMRFWSWPATGVGTHTYNASGYGSQTANFGATTYNWSAMPLNTTTFNDEVSRINYHAGVSVNMGYGATESGAFVTIVESPITNCAEYALKTYFNYAPSLHGYQRGSFSDSLWTNLLKGEFDHGRPVIYSGSGSLGGHCWVGDGYSTYTTLTYVHFNWGWGGYCNGNFLLAHISPGTEDFNSDQTAIAGIRPNNGSATAVAPVSAADAAIAVYPNPASQVVNVDLNGTTASAVTMTDMLGREVYKQAVANGQAQVNIPVAGFAAGMYLVQVQTAGELITRKIVVAK